VYGRGFTETNLPFAYPPFALLLLVPATWMSLSLAAAASLVLSLSATVAVGAAACARLGLRGWTLSCAALLSAGLASVTEPFWATLMFGQVNIVLMCLVVVDATWVPARMRGVLTGVAAAVKLTPLVFVLYFAWRRDWRALGLMLLAFVGATVVGLVALPSEFGRYLSTLRGADAGNADIGIVTNQSLRGAAIRAFGVGPTATVAWAVASLVAIGLLAGALSRLSPRESPPRDALLSLSLVALVGLLVSPVSWTQHWVWCLPLVVLLLGGRQHPTAMRVSGLVLLVAVTVAVPDLWSSSLPRPVSDSWWDRLALSNVYVIAGLLILVATAAGARRARARSA